MTTFGVFDPDTYAAALNYVNANNAEHVREMADNTPAHMTYADTVVMEFPLNSNYSESRYDIAEQYTSKHHAAAEAAAAAPATGGRRRNGRRRNSRRRNTKGHIKYRGGRNSNKRMRRSCRR
jgi:hypothetical protein